MRRARAFILAAFLFLEIAAIGVRSCKAQTSAADALPNVVLILSDDQGYNDVGAYGSEIPTPHLDRLGSQGIRFTNWYAAASVCTPSRYGLLTGRYPNRAQNGLDNVLMPTREPDHRFGLTGTEKTLGTVLAANGYRTFFAGKWHLGLGQGGAEKLPTRHGFESFYGHTAGCIDYFDMSYGILRDWYRDEQLISESGYATDLISDEAVRIIDGQSSSDPFLLVLSYNAPHYGKAWDVERGEYRNVLQAKEEDLQAFAHIKDLDRRTYAAMVKALDDGIGRVMEALERAGLDEETIVIFMSDNGGTTTYGGSNLPLRGEKNTLWEGGIRVPAFVRWSGSIPAGRVIHEPVTALDVFPTLLALLELPTKGLILDGSDIRSILFRDQSIQRDLFWQLRGWKALRQGEWKFLQPPDEEPQLFHLKEDPSEQEDLARKHPDVLAALMEAHARQAQSFD